MKEPCKQCPYRKDSLKGYLGESSYNPTDFLTQLEFSIHPCHKTVDWDNNKFEKAKVCIGALQFMNNSFQLSKSNDVIDMQKIAGKNDEIISFKHNFIKHHSK